MIRWLRHLRLSTAASSFLLWIMEKIDTTNNGFLHSWYLLKREWEKKKDQHYFFFVVFMGWFISDCGLFQVFHCYVLLSPTFSSLFVRDLSWSRGLSWHGLNQGEMRYLSKLRKLMKVVNVMTFVSFYFCSIP